ncbi:hypothetical protein FE783_13770 [Paenibacillus mesophilus]|uniref:hypothetical protein n=1 Tax=Paenibacillus mesophilus TaxID=2582849 RepID=UPI00110DCAAD|nr:hypothetical protein [Paenibacillus mesophilus]TMV49565.1 hypothetical protein FE783_13770 [Paenibacillus mesophilus]
MEIPDWKIHLKAVFQVIERVFTFLFMRFIKDKFLVKLLFLVIGVLPPLYIIGYITLYGLYFGSAKASILTLVMQYIPFNRFACLSVGLLFTGITAFIWWLYVSWRDRKKLGTKLHNLILIPALFVVLMHIGLMLFFATQDIMNREVLLKLLLIWTGPLTILLLVGIMKFLYHSLGVAIAGAIITMLVYLLIFKEVQSLLYYPFLLVGTWTMAKLLRKHHTNSFGVIWSGTLCFLLCLLYVCRTVWGVNVSPRVWIPVLASVVLSYGMSKWLHKIYIRWRERRNAQKKDNTALQFSHMADIGIYYWSITTLTVIPMAVFIMYTTGSYIGGILKQSAIYTDGTIRLGETSIPGNVVTSDSESLYISTPERTLKVVRPGNQSVVIE